MDNCVCGQSKWNGSPFNICFESKAFNCNSLGLLEFVVVVYKGWLWNLYFYSMQLWVPTSICRWWWWWKGKEKEDTGQSFGHFSTCGQSFPLVGRLENDLLQDLENDLLQRMIFWEWSFAGLRAQSQYTVGTERGWTRESIARGKNSRTPGFKLWIDIFNLKLTN